jgi:hypothetical protein
MFWAMPDQRDPGTPIMNILSGSIEIYQSWYYDSKLREEVQDYGTFVPTIPHIDPTGRTNQLEETVPWRDS